MPLTSSNDQAEGLRQMFAHARASFVPVISNPHVAFGGVMLERLCAAFAERGATVLVVDAAERAGEAGEMALVDLGQCVERLAPSMFYVAARGLPLRFVDSAGSTRDFLRVAGEAAPHCNVVLVHANAPELCRLFSPGRRRGDVNDAGPGAEDAAEAPCAIALADDRPSSVTHAYAAMKLLSRRAGLVVFDLLLAAAPHSPRAERIAARLGRCADDFFGAVLRHWSRIDPAGDPGEAPAAALRQLVDARLGPRPRAPARVHSSRQPALANS